MNKPAVSVLIDTYNHERYIEQAIVSVLEQDFPAPDMEIVVVDDGSTDRTPEIVRKLAPRVRLLRKKNGGQASAFNAAIPQLQGEVVAFLDGDDWLAPGKLTAVMRALREHPEVAAVGHGYREFHEKTGEFVDRIPDETTTLHLRTAAAAEEASYKRNFLLLGALTVRKCVLAGVVPIPEFLKFTADSPIAMAAVAGGALVLREQLCYYRIHSQNLYEIDPSDAARVRRRNEMYENMFPVIERQLTRLKVPPEAVVGLLYREWVRQSRVNLRAYGGSPLKTFRTEMRYLRLHHKNPTNAYLLYKYFVAGPAMLLLPPKAFYRLQDWCSRRNFHHLRDKLIDTDRALG